MSGRRPRPSSRAAWRGKVPERGSVKAEILRHGHGWLAAIASLVGVFVTVAVAAGVFDQAPSPSPSPGFVATGDNAAGSPPGVLPAESGSPPSSLLANPPGGSGGGVQFGGNVTATADLVPTLEAFDLPAAAPYAEYVSVGDDERGIRVEAPAEWSDTYAGNWLAGQGEETTIIGDMVLATPSERGLYAGYATAGIFFAASTQHPGLNGEELMDALESSTYQSCEWAGDGDFANEQYLGGHYELFWNCDGEEIIIVDLAAPARDGSHSIAFQARLTSTADIVAFIRAIDSFRYAPSSSPQMPGSQFTP